MTFEQFTAKLIAGILFVLGCILVLVAIGLGVALWKLLS